MHQKSSIITEEGVACRYGSGNAVYFEGDCFDGNAVCLEWD